MLGKVKIVLQEKAEEVMQEAKTAAYVGFWTGYNMTNNVAERISRALPKKMHGQTNAGAIVTMVAGVGVTIGFVLLFLYNFQKNIDNTSTAYSALGDIQQYIKDNVVWVGLILLAGLGGIAYAIAKSMGLLG